MKRNFRHQSILFLSILAAFGVTLESLAQAQAPRGKEIRNPKSEIRNKSGRQTVPAADARKPDVVYVPTPQRTVDKMLEMAQIKPGDLLYDLGCGDGRIVVTAAKKFGVRAIGVDIDPQRIKESLENVRTNHVDHLVTIKQADIFTLDLSEANVVTLYLLPELNVRLMPQLAKLKPGSRIVSHQFDMKGAKPVETYRDPDGGEAEDFFEAPLVYKWVVPWEKERGGK